MLTQSLFLMNEVILKGAIMAVIVGWSGSEVLPGPGNADPGCQMLAK
jgi:hypothetical protein